MRFLGCMCLMAAFAGVSTFATAQDRRIIVPSPIMVVDFERIFVETLYGQRIATSVSAERERVQADNDRIAAELLAEETALTEARATMDQVAFRDAARAFNERAQSVRSDREAEQTKLVQLRDVERTQFLERIRPIILALMLERSAVVAMDRRAVIQAIGGANATADAIDLIDTTLGDGMRAPNERPTLRPNGLPEVAPIIADDAPSQEDALPQSE
jgi:Skp family chaperone for outer membrane proteins